jgi:hypothetical protein
MIHQATVGLGLDIMVSSDVITLGNLAGKLPPWKPDDESHLYAVVDMGRYVQAASASTARRPVFMC